MVLKLCQRANEHIEYLKTVDKSHPRYGKFAVVDPDTGKFWHGDKIVDAVKTARKVLENDNAVFHAIKVGHLYTHSIGLRIRE